MWERTLQDLIKGLRANKKDESKFIAKAIDEIRREVQSKDNELKAAAVLKLTYLEMMGYDMGWAAFHVVEVMSSQRFHHKAVGYLAAAQSFTQDTDVLMLTTNLVKKDLTATPTEVAQTLSGLAQIVTPDLARDVAHEITTMLTHSRAHIRKRAVLVLYKVILRYPAAQPLAFPRFREKLEDPDPGVQCAAVNVLCELARRDPVPYLPLAPQLFHILTSSSNNWMLIKVIKLFGALAPHEPRLVRKLQPPITDLIETTAAISLLYECVHTCIIGGMLAGEDNALAQTCVRKLVAFLSDTDQNLRYIALLALVKIVPSHPHLLAQSQDVVLASVDDPDVSIRMRALDLVAEMVDEDNIQSIVQHLLAHIVRTDAPDAATALARTLAGTAAPVADSTAYRTALAARILAICARDTYARVRDFAWLLSVLVDLAHVAPAPPPPALARALIDIPARVRAIRPFAAALMARELGAGGPLRVPAAWVVGEYPAELAEPQRVLADLLADDAEAVCVQAAMKVFGHWAAVLATEWSDARLPEVQRTVEALGARLGPLAGSADAETQERAANMLGLLAFVRADLAAHKPACAENGHADAHEQELNFPKSLFLLRPLYAAYELGPVAPAAQAAVRVPPGLDLTAWIVPPPPAPAAAADAAVARKSKRKGQDGAAQTKKPRKPKTGDTAPPDGAPPPAPAEEPEDDAEEHARRTAARLARQRDDPYYLVDDRPAPAPAAPRLADVHDVDSIPVVRLDVLLPSPALPVLAPLAPMTVDRGGAMPAGAAPPQAPAPIRTPPAPASAIPAAFQEYIVDDADDSAPSTPPEPIIVVRAKKGTGKKKKKGET